MRQGNTNIWPEVIVFSWQPPRSYRRLVHGEFWVGQTRVRGYRCVLFYYGYTLPRRNLFHSQEPNSLTLQLILERHSTVVLYTGLLIFHIGLGLLGFNASATARVISRRWNDDEISFLVEETGVPGGNHRPTASNWRNWWNWWDHTYGLCSVRGLNLGRSGVKQSELRRNESGALAHRATAVPIYFTYFKYWNKADA